MQREQEKESHFGIVNFERRMHPRFSLDLPVEYWPISGSKSRPARTINVSEGGLLLHLPEEIEMGKDLRLRLFIDSGLDFISIEALVQVVWREMHSKEEGYCRTGVKFIDISQKDMTNLKNFLTSLMDLKTHSEIDIPSRLLSSLGLSAPETFPDPSLKVPD